MTFRIGICVLAIAAIVGDVLGAAPEKPANGAKQTSSGATVTASPVGKQSTPPAQKAKPSGTQSQIAVAKKKDAAGKPKLATAQKEVPSKEGSEPSGAGESATATSGNVRRMRGQRDPFETVIRSQPEGPGCSVGKKCLVVDKMDLKGVVRSQNGMIAIVSTDQRKTYFLHESDPIYNGHVVKINPDSIVFRETVTDRVGRQSTRDVVKRITRPAA